MPFDLTAAKADLYELPAQVRADLQNVDDSVLVAEAIRRIARHESGAKGDQQKIAEFLWELVNGVVPHSLWKGGRTPAGE